MPRINDYTNDAECLRALCQASNMLLLNLDACREGLDAQVGVAAATEAVRRTLEDIKAQRSHSAREFPTLIAVRDSTLSVRVLPHG